MAIGAAFEAAPHEIGPVERPAPPPDVRVEGLRKCYPGEASDVLCGVDCRIATGERVALLGSNGSGKSTLLRCLVRLVDSTAGRVHLFGEDVLACRGADLRRLRAQTGFVFQRHNLVDRLSVLSNVLHGAQNRQAGPFSWFQTCAPMHLRDEALACLERVGLVEYASRRADRLSGGQSQRVAIARALMQRPRLVLADEPSASLDPASGDQVMELLTSLMTQQGTTVLFSTHDVDHARRYADRVIGLRKGSVVCDGPIDEVSGSDLHTLYGQVA
jgi:phosphonate transport system ATP-binding protein